MSSKSRIKATSFLCLLGFGIGFGSVLLYKLYNRIAARWWGPTDKSLPSNSSSNLKKRAYGRRHSRRPSKNSDDEDSDQTSSEDDNDLAAGGTMGNQISEEKHRKYAVYYEKYKDNVRFANSATRPEGGGLTSSTDVNVPRGVNIRNRRGRYGQNRGLHSQGHNGQQNEESGDPLDDLSPNSTGATYMDYFATKYLSAGGATASADYSEVDNALQDENQDTISRDFSMMGNFSPGSLYEKNYRYDPDRIAYEASGLPGDPNFQYSPLKEYPMNCDDTKEQSYVKVKVPDSLNQLSLEGGDCQGNVQRRQLPERPQGLRRSYETSSENNSPMQVRRKIRSTSDADLVYKRQLSDYNDLSGIETTDSDIFGDGESVPSVASYFEKIERELAALKGEMADMDDKIQVLGKDPDFSDIDLDLDQFSEPEDLDRTFSVLKKYNRSGSLRSSRASSVSGDRDLRQSPQRGLATSDIVTQVQHQLMNDKFHVHVHVHVHDEKKTDINKQLLTQEYVEKLPLAQSPDDTSSSSCGVSMPSCDSSKQASPVVEDRPVEDYQEQPSDITNNNGSGNSQSGPTRSTKGSVPVSVGDLFDILTYADQEWRGNTVTAKNIIKGYHVIPDKINCQHLRKIRGDNYCAIRASLFQIFVNNVGLFNHVGSLNNLLETLEERLYGKHSYLRDWSFANRLERTSNDVLENMRDCLTSLHNMFNEVSNLTCRQDRESAFMKMVNGDEVTDIRMMEGVKLLMMLHAIDVYEDMTADREVPVFVWLMYARDTSDNPRMLFKNHINTVGDSGGLEQVEMFLLGHTLGVIIEVVRPSQYSSEDFLSYYPSDMQKNLPTITLVAEDDRHYNVVLP
ncbi:uncharacterized protein LOC135492082 isoform X2 [Lineus longissimus]|uniref:uncharacterized protein LOC135492082 isoform X2 n=1 Tax=Lineus longissimus TaxID=88925 RepID=UPI002B4E49AA